MVVLCHPADLAPCFRTLGFHTTEAETRKLFEEAAPSGKMDYMGFLVCVAKQTAAIKSREAMIKAFRVFDPDRKGYVTTAEFRGLMGKLGTTIHVDTHGHGFKPSPTMRPCVCVCVRVAGDHPLPVPLIDEMIAFADPDDVGQIEYETFVHRVFDDFQAHEKAKAAAIAAAKAGVKGKGK